MVFCVVSVIFGKLFPNVVGTPLTRVYKKYASHDIFITYCGNNPYNRIVGGLGAIGSTGGGRILLAAGGLLFGQDIIHKSGIGQYPKYQFEKFANNGNHPSGKPFTFKDNGPSWADNLSRYGKRD